MERERVEIPVGGGQRVYEGDGILEIVFDGTVDERPMQVVADVVQSRSLQQGVGEPRIVMVIDITKLGSFTPGGRRAIAATKPSKEGVPNHTHLFVVGATIRTKAMFTLVLAAARLIGDTRFDTHYCASPEEGLAAARKTRDELRAKGLLVG